MRRLLISCTVALPLLALTAGPALAEVKTREKTHAKIEGVIGGIVNFFGGKAAKEGVVSTAAVKGNRKATMNESTGQIIDLSEEKIYDLDMKKKTYEVTTFAELRRRMREAREKAEKEAQNQKNEDQKEEKTSEKPKEPEKEYQFDFDVKETGQKKQLAGYDTRQVIMTVTVHEKGKPIEDVGGFVMTADSWLGPQVAALKELAAFDLRYWQQLEGTEAVGLSPEQMATVVAMYPALKPAMDRMAKEGTKLEGTPLATTMTFEMVKSKEMMAQQAENKSSGGSGGLGGMLARRMQKKDASEPKARTLVFTTEHEYQELSTAVAASDLELPAGFTQKK
jgi:hypothetical protein